MYFQLELCLLQYNMNSQESHSILCVIELFLSTPPLSLLLIRYLYTGSIDTVINLMSFPVT